MKILNVADKKMKHDYEKSILKKGAAGLNLNKKKDRNS